MSERKLILSPRAGSVAEIGIVSRKDSLLRCVVRSP